jgi:Tfp pilus assembly protein FimT
MLALNKDTRGVILAELVMVLAIVGILLTLAVPSFIKYLPGIRLKGDARDVASVLRLARMRAVAERAQYGVYFDEGETPPRFVLFQDVDEDEAFDDAADEIVFSQELYRRTRYHEVNVADNVAVFRANGASNGGSILLGLSQGSDSLVVDILPSTGRVKVIR